MSQTSDEIAVSSTTKSESRDTDEHVAEIVEDTSPEAPPDKPSSGSASKFARRLLEQPDIPPQFQNLAAKGGAVAALVLGVMAIIGIFFSQLSLFNATIGLVFGIWGLTSNAQWISQVGIGLCLITFALAAFGLN